MSDNAASRPGSLEERVERFAERIDRLRQELRRKIVGQDEVVTQVLAAILAEGHCLIVGLPGLAKTLLVSTIAELLSLDFKRIQFTPDLMPSDITGASLIVHDGGERGFRFLKGPIFTNVLLADEINRTPPKTQAALIEAMEERQVSVGGRRFPLQRPFIVLATENPIELEGTYPLPVSQLDRFLFNITIDYPGEPEEFRMLLLTTSTYEARLSSVLERDELAQVTETVRQIEVNHKLLDYAARIVRATRPSGPGAAAPAKEFIAWGAGPRATQALIAGARALALMAGRPEVRAEDMHAVVVPTLRHRIVLRYHAEAEGISSDDLVRRILEGMPDGLYEPPPGAGASSRPASSWKRLLERLPFRQRK